MNQYGDNDTDISGLISGGFQGGDGAKDWAKAHGGLTALLVIAVIMLIVWYYYGAQVQAIYYRLLNQLQGWWMGGSTSDGTKMATAV